MSRDNYDWTQEVGEGWRPLVEAFIKFIELKKCIEIGDVKEKFGALRIYFDHDYNCSRDNCPMSDECWGATAVLEELSIHICEVCGAVGSLRQGSWIKTLCDHHADGREPYVGWQDSTS